MESAQVASHPYQAVAARIIAKIKTGDLRLNDKLPSVRQLAKDEDVSPMTAQKALTHLAESGYAKAVQGVGYFVTDLPEGELTPVTITDVVQQVEELRAEVKSLRSRVDELEGTGQ
jgi:DNA-binding GntR family transcriptional regulator